MPSPPACQFVFDVPRKKDYQDGMTTKFHAWLKARGEAPFAFARRHHVSGKTTRFLAGIRNDGRVYHVTLEFMEKVSKETGIPIQTLYDEAKKATKNPLPPRPYRRRTKEEADGTRTEAQER